ncbi:facilitated trehalose transporter Tret1-like isoform X2 [Photinus pyralis]|nr:facilitated trehalose transporter Tret1-like isoform X2 [Photinus pyralis]
MYMSWSSPVIPQLTFFSSAEVSWIVSILSLGSIPGSILGGLLLNKIGRKKTILLATAFLFFPWVAIALSTDAVIFMIARFMGGIGMALAPITVPVYIGEIADKDIRGRLALVYSLLSTSGTVLTLSVGPYISYKWLSVLGAAFPAVCALALLPFPESPYYLLQVDKREAARESLARLAAKTENCDATEIRFLQIEKIIADQKRERKSVKDIIWNKDFRKSMLLVLGMKTIHQLSGANGIKAYMETIMRLSQTDIPPQLSSVIFGSSQIPSVLISALLIDRLGRKPLMIVSTLGCAVGLICEGVYFYLDYLGNIDLSPVNWLPTFGLTLFHIMVSFGVSSLPYVLYGELFITSAKGLAGAILIIYSGCLTFVVMKSFGPAVEALGIYVVFWGFAGACLLGTFFGVFVLPETKGKALNEIQDLINK